MGKSQIDDSIVIGIPPLEKDVQMDILKWLEFKRFFFWRCNNLPAMGRPDKNGQMRFRSLPKFTPKGLPDIIIIHDGEFLGLEVKRANGKVSPDQAEFGRRIRENGAYYAVVRHLDEAMIAVNGLWPNR